MVVTSCYSKAKEEHQDEVDVIAQIKNQIEAGGEFPTKRNLHNCNQQTRDYMWENLIENAKNVERSPKESLAGLTSSNFTAFKNNLLSRVKTPKKLKPWETIAVLND